MTTEPRRASFSELATALLASVGDENSAMLFALQVAGAATDDYVPIPVEPWDCGSFEAAIDALQRVRRGEKDDVAALAVAKAFGDFRARVTQAEAVGSRRVSMILNALRTFEGAGDDPLAARLATDLRVHLLSRWNYRVPEPCPSAGESRTLCSTVALRLDLLPAEWRAR